MLAEFVQKIASLAEKAQAPQPIQDGDPAVARFLVGGEVREFPRPLPPRLHRVDTLDDLVRMATRFDGEAQDPAATVALRPVCWVAEEEVRLTLDDDGRRASSVVMPLETTSLWDAIVGLDGGPNWCDHREFLRLLRIDLAGALPPSALLEKVRRVSFESGQVVRSKVGRADESLGREITGKVTAEAELPELVTLTARVYRGLEYEAVVPCAVEIDTARGALALVPLPDAISQARDHVLGLLAADLSDRLPGSVPCYRGRP